ncbi:MAG: SPASM domain-containing protein [Planctomycetota bacterium]
MPALHEALKSAQADASLLVGGDWCVVDPSLCEALIRRHQEAAEAMPLCFSQAPPGLSGLVVSAKLLGDLASANRGFADLLAYSPARPAVDPISQEFNLAVSAGVRSTARRFIYDTPDAVARIRAAHESLSTSAFYEADAETLTSWTRQDELANRDARFEHLPPICEVELTPRRVAHGPITPQYAVTFDRGDFDPHRLDGLSESLRGHAVTLGGIGEPLLHPQWNQAVRAFRDADASAIALQTDLLAEDNSPPEQVAAAIMASEVDVVFVRLNAETADVYAAEMGVDRFDDVLETLQALFRLRAERSRQEGAGRAFPLIVPTLTKTRATTPSMEHFFERWWQLADHAAIFRSPQGGRGTYALATDQNPVPMDPPWLEPDPHQFKHRLTVLSNGRVCLCHEDWLGRAAIGDLAHAPLDKIWRDFPDYQLNADWRHDASPYCPRCFSFSTLHTKASALATV